MASPTTSRLREELRTPGPPLAGRSLIRTYQVAEFQTVSRKARQGVFRRAIPAIIGYKHLFTIRFDTIRSGLDMLLQDRNDFRAGWRRGISHD